MNPTSDVGVIGMDESPGSGPGDVVVTMLHELRLVYPHESDAVLGQALLQARKNLPPHESFDAVQREVGRLLGVLAVLRLKAEVE